MAETYDIKDYDSDNDDSVPGNENLLSATEFVTDLFEKNGIVYAVMGGFCVSLLGGTRETRVVDVCFQAKHGFREIWGVIEGQERLIIPKSRKVSGVLKMFVKTGPNHARCSASCQVEIDLIEAGMFGSPRDLSSHRRPINIGSHGRTIQTLDMLYILRSKMGEFKARDIANDRVDILFLLGKYTEEAKACRQDLDHEAVEFFIEKAPEEERCRWEEFFGLSILR